MLRNLRILDTQIGTRSWGIVMDVLQILSQAMQVPKDKLTGNETLSDIAAWDSLAILSFMAFVDKNCGIVLRPDELLKCESISDIEALINNHA